MKRHIFFLLKFAASVVLLWLVARQFYISEILEVLARVSVGSVIVLLLIGIAQTLMHSHRWQLVSRSLGTEVYFQQLNRLVFIGLFFNQTLPTSFGGDAVRIAMSRRFYPSLSRAIACVLMDRIIALIALVGIIAICLPFLARMIANPPLIWSLSVIVAISTVGVGFVVVFGAAGERLLSKIPVIKSLGFLLGDFRRSLAAPRQTPPIAGYSVVIHFMTCIMIYLLARGMEIELSFLQSLFLVPTIILISALPLSFAGWGIREGVMVYLLDHIGIAGSDALAISIAFGLVMLVLGIPGGLMWLTRSHESGERRDHK